jgi:hypothetical protein
LCSIGPYIRGRHDGHGCDRPRPCKTTASDAWCVIRLVLLIAILAKSLGWIDLGWATSRSHKADGPVILGQRFPRGPPNRGQVSTCMLQTSVDIDRRRADGWSMPGRHQWRAYPDTEPLDSFLLHGFGCSSGDRLLVHAVHSSPMQTFVIHIREGSRTSKATGVSITDSRFWFSMLL